MFIIHLQITTSLFYRSSRPTTFDEYKCLYTGTARETRMGNPGLPSSVDLNKKSVPRGMTSFKSRDGILALKWKDTKVVSLLSSASGVEPKTTVLRYDKVSKSPKEVICPNLIKEYNKNMGGIDKSDMLGHLYSSPMRSRRWYLPIFGYILDVSISNAWILYKRECCLTGEKNSSLKDFRIELSSSLLRSSEPMPRVFRVMRSSPSSTPPVATRGKRVAPPPESLRFNAGEGHLPLFTGQRRACQHYSSQSNIHRSRWMCDTCNVALCLTDKSNCFRNFHQH